ncbi:MAG TPA: hypothetical protein VJ748_10135 [Vitreimonas sp.]|nr:hypothetical protein [Vitreimonas sp.]
MTGSAGAPSYGLGWGLIMKITIPLPLRIAAAVVVCTLGVAVAAAWMDHHGLWDLPLTLPTPADPTRWRNTVHLSAWIVGVAFAVELLIPPKPSDFGGGAAAYIAAVAGGALALLLLYHSSISAPASWREMAADWRNLASMGVRYVFFAFAVTTIVRWMMMLHKRRAQAARSRTAAPSTFFLFLRPFELDPLLENWSRQGIAEAMGLQLNRSNGIEEALSELVYDVAPMMAIGESVVGARKLHFTDDTWKDEARRLIRDAEAIFFVPGSSPGALWEAQQLADPDNFALHKTLWLMPPKRHVSQSFNVAPVWEAARAQLAARGIHAPDYDDWGGVFMAHEYRDEQTGAQGVQLWRVPQTRPSLLQQLVGLVAPPTGLEHDLVATARAVLEAPFFPPRHYLSQGLAPTRFMAGIGRGHES